MKSQKKQNAKIRRRRQIIEGRKITSKESALWKIFLKNEEKDFKELYKFGKEEIERIGVNKFFSIMGFDKKEDLSKWRTDALHICICPDCKNNFGIYEFYSVCSECEEKYDMSKVKKAHTLMVAENKNEANPGEFLFAFMASKQLRNFYLADSPKTKNVIYALKYELNTQDWHVYLIQDLKRNDTVKYVLSDGSTYKENDRDVFRLTDDVTYDEVTKDLIIKYEASEAVLPINALTD